MRGICWRPGRFTEFPLSETSGEGLDLMADHVIIKHRRRGALCSRLFFVPPDRGQGPGGSELGPWATGHKRGPMGPV